MLHAPRSKWRVKSAQPRTSLANGLVEGVEDEASRHRGQDTHPTIFRAKTSMTKAAQALPIAVCTESANRS